MSLYRNMHAMDKRKTNSTSKYSLSVSELSDDWQR